MVFVGNGIPETEFWELSTTVDPDPSLCKPNKGSGELTVPSGFRFHPTDEELLYYYLRRNVSYDAIDLDVIREVDLNRLEPWDLKGRNWYSRANCSLDIKTD
ncbi:hypothetical protein P8452_59908 [Trifolium repens]|nr:hypothetical protein P8452_59908 [Trifolium repens]